MFLFFLHDIAISASYMDNKNYISIVISDVTNKVRDL